ncbi:hypothetical protein GCM10028805_63610 [Spirosoma harenae]
MKKLQIFVSSTYSDLLEERQACVETILSSGHIPAGMELFAAGSESQLETIKRWIDNCDVYMLILGGRYGSLEPKSKLSYTEVEYRYALEKKKPFFAVVMSDEFLDEKVKKDGKDVFERKYPDKYEKFKKFVKSKTVKFFSNNDGIKVAVIQSLFDIQNRFDLKGWVKGDEIIDVKPLIKQIDLLTQENNELKLQLKNINRRKSTGSKSKRSLKQFEFEGTMYTVEHWRDMLTKVLDILAEDKRLKDPDVLFALNSKRALFFTFDEKKVSRPYKIPLTKIYLGTHQSPDSFQRLTKSVVKAVGLSENSFRIIGELPRG